MTSLLKRLQSLQRFEASADRLLVYANLHRNNQQLSTLLRSHAVALAELEQDAPCAPCAQWMPQRTCRGSCQGCSRQRSEVLGAVATLLAKGGEPTVAQSFARAAGLQASGPADTVAAKSLAL